MTLRPRHRNIKLLVKPRRLLRRQCLLRNRVVRRQSVRLVDGLLAVLLDLHRRDVLRVALDPLRGLDVLDGLAVQAVVARRQGVAHRREARARDRDLRPGRLCEIAQLQGVGDQAIAPVTEGNSGLALPVDSLDEVAQLIRGDLDGRPCLPERITRVFEVLRIGVVDQVDHRVELVALERSPSRRARTSEAE
ncbi:hypothetical protein [Streptomyces sp. NPDC058092]|uniref:hypothetical protein n=1 Tax=Streptomyces sp. NPDC058092 TaxID=3346336 RepID=UPI0036EB63B9